MSEPDFDVVAIGNAIVDVIVHASDDFLAQEGLQKGAMTLIDADRARDLYGRVGPAVEISGGSAANTAAGIAGLGGRVAFVGKVAADQLGEVFTHDIRAVGVHFDTSPLVGGPSTARCIVLVTPDAHRTLNTYLGACAELHAADVDPDLVARSAYTYLEGYLWDPVNAKDAFRKAMGAAADAGRRVALTLSDSFCVERFRSEFLDLAADHVDVLFANEDEIRSLFETEDFEVAAGRIAGEVEIAVLTRSEKGSVILSGGERIEVPAHPVERLVDTTGAGDLYAAGFLRGLAGGQPLETCGRLGSLAAAEVISHIGARPEVDLTVLARHLLE